MATQSGVTLGLSDRALGVKDSITMAVSALAAKLRREGQDVLGFSAGEPDFDTPQAIKQAGIDAIAAGKTKYTPASGIVDLKEAVIKKLQRDQGLTYTADQIVISCGAKHSIFNVLMAVINPGDEVIVPSPYWVSYPDQVKIFGGEPVVIETTQETNFKITPDQLRAAATPQTKLLILNSPSNPTGMVYTRDELEALAQVAIEHNIFVLSDEIYEKLVYDGEFTSFATLSEAAKERTILINGMSKAYSMTGWRLGYVACDPALAKAIGKLQSQSTSNPCTPAQWAGIEALLGDEAPVDEMRAAFEERRNYMVKRLNAIPGISCLTPQGAFYAFPKVTGLMQAKGLSTSVDLCKALLEDVLVACVPGSGFGAEGHVRLSYATSMENIEKGMDRILKWAS